MTSEQNICLKRLREETRLTPLQCRNLAERTNYDLDKALVLHKNPTPYVAQLFSDKYVLLGRYDLQVGSSGTPVIQEVLDDPDIQSQIKTGLLRVGQLGVPEEEEDDLDLPFATSKFFSSSTVTTCKFCTVLLTAPMWPGKCCPLNTLEG